MKAGQLLMDTIAQFKDSGIASARLDALLLLEAVTGKDRSFLLAHEDYELDQNQHDRFKAFAAKRAKRLPVAYILGQKEFCGIDFFVSQSSLVPRIETENMVEYIISSLPDSAKLVDVGTGSGVIAVCVKFKRPDLIVAACDISADTLVVAQKNALAHNVSIDFIKSDLLESVPGKFDLIAANLPYVPDGRALAPEVEYEPALALFGGIDGLDGYRRLLKQAREHLSPGGVLLIEHEPGQLKSLEHLSAKAGFKLSSVSDYISKLA